VSNGYLLKKAFKLTGVLKGEWSFSLELIQQMYKKHVHAS
jgi:hypothetical protein